MTDIRQSVLAWDRKKMDWKLEYELGAILEETARQFYYWGIVDEYPKERHGFLEYIANFE